MNLSHVSEQVHISDLRCEYLVAPTGIDECEPRLSWAIASRRRGARQTAFRLRVAGTLEKIAAGVPDFWDSGRIESSQTTHVVYAGKPLCSRDICHWQVEVWDEAGNYAISAPSHWSMGLLEKSDWMAKWIAADPEIIRRDTVAIAPSLTEPGTPALFRREFEVPGAIKRATLYTSARGLFELRANGKRVSADVFAPEWTDYHQRIHYRTYDITTMLVPGRNALAATLGDGWWSGYVGWQETRARYGSIENSLMIQIEIELVDGKSVFVNTDSLWRCNTGPILASDFMMGETYDARRERTGWDDANFSDNDWLPAREIAAPTASVVAQRSEPVRIMETIAPVSKNEIQPGVFIYDLGQNISGWVRLRVNAPAGTRVTIRHGERLNPDGTLYTDNLRRARATDVYICKGSGEETYEPHFTFHGFQYVELTGLPSALGTDAIVGCVVRSGTSDAGKFECSHAGVNRLWLNGLWSQRDNFLSVPTDCPQRDERLGWMGDAQVFLRTASYNMDVAAFFTKWIVDVEDAQTADGIFPDTAPRLREGENYIGLGRLVGAAGWADAGIIIPWTIWRVYGDSRIMKRHWSAMVKWLDWIERHNPESLHVNELGNNYGDWLCIPSDTSFGTHSPMKNLLATGYWADDAAKMSVMARALGHDAEAERFQKMFERVRTAFQKEWLRDDGRLAVETQTAYLLALAFDLLPENVRSRVAEHLVDNIKALSWHLSTGFIGISHLNPQLTLTGHADVAYRLLLQDDYPSWLYPVKHGATTIWERWNGWTEEEGFFAQMNSFNHYSLGSVGEWLFRHVAGIELDPATPGFQKFVLRPFIGDGLDFAKASYRTMHGEIGSEWRQNDKNVIWSVCIPANTSARVYVPSKSGTPVTESDTLLEKEATGIRVVGREDNFMVCEVASGLYKFKSTL
ncbi:MAG TPA: family 78 glycoside hydrolase catalytic domain [Verrucomicrobiae bacterium]|jgi:alpha-L-rhamnosidase|nr:family 78 glycoside hydrolase catalytic domain [Verrucomicrobiae bacterium]